MIFWIAEATAVVLIMVMVAMVYAIYKNTLLLNHMIQRIQQRENERQQESFDGEQAERWFEKGELQRLNRYCEDYIKKTPNSVHANWYYALSHFNQGQYEIARQYFENVVRINPLWRDGAIVYLQEIAEKIGLPQSHSLH
ncbi:MAG: hypothetical protein CSA45_02940 [Gammaproteobacteria bacterium]|nr:MAG: hypothetical protein CSA45_02940 [Gammaproteobacteria bacterium]